MKTKAMLLATAATLALAGTAEAGNFNGWYIGVEGGASWVQNWNFTSGTTSHTHFDTADFDTGWAALATVGYAYKNWRFEVEAGYRSNDIDVFTTGGVNTTGGVFGPYFYTGLDASLHEFTLMANVLYDVKIGGRLSLSLGVGAGADHVDLEFGAGPNVDIDEWRFAAQGIAGLNYAVSRRIDLFLNYRYLWVDAIDIPVGPFNGHVLNGADDFQKHAVTLGLRFDLAADEMAAPPPPPAPPPAPPAPPAMKQFIVFFGFNKCNITTEADQVLSEAASTAKSTGSAAISIVGHTDTVGSAAYNQKLSECRADAAKSNLVDKGIPSGSISASGRGESDLIVQTGDGIKEPQNRRATIDLK